MKTDIVIVGCGAAGLYCALNLPSDRNVVIVTKDKMESMNPCQLSKKFYQKSSKEWLTPFWNKEDSY